MLTLAAPMGGILGHDMDMCCTTSTYDIHTTLYTSDACTVPHSFIMSHLARPTTASKMILGFIRRPLFFACPPTMTAYMLQEQEQEQQRTATPVGCSCGRESGDQNQNPVSFRATSDWNPRIPLCDSAISEPRHASPPNPPAAASQRACQARAPSRPRRRLF